MAPLELDDAPDAEPSAAFAVLKQKLELDFSFSPQSVKGKTTIEIQPQDKNLRVLQLNCRQLNITAVRVDGYSLKLDGPDADCYYSDLYKRLALYPGTDIHQHHFMKSRLQRHTAGLELELEINIPKFVEIRPMNAEDAARNEDVVAQGMSFDGEMYNPIRVEIEYNLENPRDAIHFVGVEDGDARYPHAFTRNSPFPGIASCLFPCVDDGATKCVFDVSIRYPRTLGDVYSKGRASPASSQSTIQAEDSPKADSVMSDVDDDPAEFADEEKALEMSVICSGELTDDISDPADPTRKTASFTCVTPVLPQHIGIAVGPFEHVDLSEYRDTLDDERLGSNAIRVHAFCLPGKADEVRNSAMVLARTLDSFTERYQSYPFEKAYKLAFVEDLDCDVAHSASFSICSSRLLFPESVWEPLEATTRTLIHAVASQWIGVNVTPQRPSDHWVIVGGSWFMTELYLRDLFGRNDHRFRLKLMTDKILQLDIRRPSLFLLGEYLSVDPGEAEFMALKAPLVLSILHHRLVKQSGKNGVDRCLYRLLFNARNEKLPNASISTDGFLDICEKVGHQKLDTFFNQWIYGSGCPTFECHPVFNKKKQVIQLTIKQTQADPMMRQEERALGADEVLREAKEKANGFRPSSEWPAFVGPMTIRIHEADGTPYEHIVDINSSTVKVEIPYNTKYKRLKKNRRDKERQALVQGMDGTGDSQEDAVFYMLGDLFQSEEESNEWKISEWSQEDYARMDQEFYEWIRVDADFEWICRANINDMPAYMYVSQLQQDKDVIAQAESLQWLALKEGHPLLSSILVKTLMDNRYFHGVRTMAADVVALSAKESLNWIGLFHLKKAFQELFCLPGQPMTRSNDFSDRSSYIIQCAIPKAIAKIKGPDGKAPMEVKSFLLDVMRYNDNRGNEYSDDHYLATLMSCLAQSLTTTKKSAVDHDPTLELNEEAEQFEFKKKALEELERHQRLDEWIPTYQNVYTTTALDCAFMLMRNKSSPLKASEFLQYTRIGNANNVRLKAWDCLINLGMIRRDCVITLMLNDIQSDPSPAFRASLIRRFNTALGQIATGDEFQPETSDTPTNGVLIVEQEEALPNREAQMARRKLDGALRALKAELSNNATLRNALEEALYSTTTSARDVAELLEICGIFYVPSSKLEVTLKLPRYWNVRHNGNGKITFYRSNKYRQRPLLPLKAHLKPQPPPPPPSLPQVQTHNLPTPTALPPVATPEEKGTVPKVKLKFGKLKDPAPATPVAPPVPTIETPIPVAVPQAQPAVLPPKPATPSPAPVATAEPKRPKIHPPKPARASPALSSHPVGNIPTPTPPPTVPRISTPAPPVRTKKQKSKIIILKLSSEKLATVRPHDQRLNPKKRKADTEGDGGERALKRQASPAPGATSRPKFIIKLALGHDNARRAEEILSRKPQPLR